MQAQMKEAPLTNEISADEAALARRFAEVPRRAKNIVCEFSQDMALNFLYYQALRRQGIAASAQAALPSQHRIIAHAGREFLGGATLTISSPAALRDLPMERDELKLLRVFPDLDLQEVSYGEISDVIVMPQPQEEEMLEQMLRGLVKMAVVEKVEYVFFAAPLAESRRLQKAMHTIGVPCEVRGNVAMPESDAFEGAVMLLSVMDIAKYSHLLRQVKRESLMLLESD